MLTSTLESWSMIALQSPPKLRVELAHADYQRVKRTKHPYLRMELIRLNSRPNVEKNVLLVGEVDYESFAQLAVKAQSEEHVRGK